MNFCNLDINFSKHSERKLDIEVFNREDLSLLVKFSILIEGSSNISIEDVEEYCSLFELKNKSTIESVDGLFIPTIKSFSLDGVRVPFMHFDVSMYDGGGVLVNSTKAHMMSLGSICNIISFEISDFCMDHIKKLKSIKCNFLTPSKKLMSLKSWAISKIEKIIMKGLYDFCNEMYLRQNFRTIDCLKRISSLCYSSAKRRTSWGRNFLPPVFCGIYCEEILNKDLYKHMTNNNSYVYLSTFFKWNGSDFCLRDSSGSCANNLFSNYGSIFYKNVYDNMPHSCGHIFGNFISSLDWGRNVSLYFDDIEFSDKKKFFKMFWMVVFCSVAPDSKHGTLNQDDSLVELLNFAKKEWTNESCLKKKLKEFSARFSMASDSKLKWLSVSNMYSMVEHEYRKIKIKKSPKLDLEFSIGESLPDIPF